MSTALVITPNLGVTSVEASVAARCRRDELVKSAATVATIDDRLDADAALPLLRSLKEFVSDVESQHKAAKAPVLEIGRKIDALKRELCDTADAAYGRISRLIGGFEQREREAAAKRQKAADDEAARIAFEAGKAEREAIKAATTAEAKARASDEVVAQAQMDIAAVRATAQPAPKAANSTLRATVCFEVTDIKALYAFAPHMVCLEPNGTIIRSVCQADPKAVIPGLRHWVEHKLNVR